VRYKGKHRRGHLPWWFEYHGRLLVAAHSSSVVTVRDIEVMEAAVNDAGWGGIYEIVRGSPDWISERR
jgi:hypothetical protein